MSTASSSDLKKMIAARLLGYTFGGASISTLTGGRLYINRPPDDPPYPNAVMRLINRQTAPEYSNQRERFDVEVMCYGIPGSSEQTIEQIADLAELALITWVDATDGLSFGRTAQRDTIPPSGDPVERELVVHRVVVDCVSWASYRIAALQAQT